MKQFEHKMLTESEFDEKILKLLGKAGWELVSVVFEKWSEDQQGNVYYFKREKPIR